MVSKQVSAYLAGIGKVGGMSGRGAVKRRSAAFYRALSRKGVKARAAKRAKE